MRLSIVYDYIHAERVASETTGQLGINVQVTFPASKQITVKEGEMAISFAVTVSTSPPVITIVLKGRLLISDKQEKLREINNSIKTGKIQPSLVQFVTSHALFEAALLTRELGLPPAIPVPIHKQKGGEVSDIRPV